jgi:hypothetical protein
MRSMGLQPSDEDVMDMIKEVGEDTEGRSGLMEERSSSLPLEVV